MLVIYQPFAPTVLLLQQFTSVTIDKGSVLSNAKPLDLDILPFFHSLSHHEVPYLFTLKA